ncbi:TPA: hypothetical protein DEP58_03785 [Patescibacteria group bacterium]|nr:MAG: Membrane protein-like protein [Parcubacteria group bacterium GW2011_GWD2_42_14]HCC05395.1 hypothetical protein [Patescibacteria group bacterium]
MLTLLLIIVVVFLWLHVKKIEDRMMHLEQYLQKATEQFGKVERTTNAVSPAVALRDEETKVQVPVPTNSTELPENPAPSAVGNLIEWLKTDWLMKLGGLLIVLGMAWFVNYAFANNWIGPMGRISLGFIVGAMILVLGRYRMNTYISQGGILMFIGALSIILTTWAGRELYGFFTPASALVLMFLIASVLGITSVHFKRPPLAYANVLLGAIAPLLTASPYPSLSGLFTYLLVLSLGSIWVASVTGWRQVIFLSLATVSMYSAPFLMDSYLTNDDGLMFAFVFSALFFFVSILGMRHIQKTSLYDVLTAVLTGLFLLAWILVDAEMEWQSLLLVTWTLVFAFGAFTAVRLGAAMSYFYAYASVGVLLLGSATAVELDGPTLTIAFILESLAVLILGFHVTKKPSLLPILAIPSIVPILLSFESMDASLWSKWSTGIYHDDSLVLALMILSGVLVVRYVLYMRSKEQDEVVRDKLLFFSNLAGTVASLYGIVYVWLCSKALFGEEYGVIIALILYIIIGSTLYLNGKKTGEKWKRVVGGALIGITSVYLLFLTGTILGVFGRVVAYTVIGVVLIGVAWHERSSSKSA